MNKAQRFERARRDLETYVQTFAPAHYGTPEAPDSWRKLREWSAAHTIGKDALPTFNGACEDTIYLTRAGNVAFRALHDSTHIRLNASFQLAGEIRVAGAQYRHARRQGVSKDAARLLFLDVAAQAHYYAQTRSFVTNQRAFVWRHWTNREEDWDS